MTVRAAMRRIGAVNLGGTVQHVNSLRGACLAQGMMAAHILREQNAGVLRSRSRIPRTSLVLEVATPPASRREIRIDHLDKFINAIQANYASTKETLAIARSQRGQCVNQRPAANLYTDEDGGVAPFHHRILMR